MNVTAEVRCTVLKLFNVSGGGTSDWRAGVGDVSLDLLWFFAQPWIPPRQAVLLHSGRHRRSDSEMLRNKKPPVICDARRNKRMDDGFRK